MAVLHILLAVIVLAATPSGRKWRTIWGRYQAH